MLYVNVNMVIFWKCRNDPNLSSPDKIYKQSAKLLHEFNLFPVFIPIQFKVRKMFGKKHTYTLL
jgi:hypothetical protein